jgi:hypothetical protein
MRHILPLILALALAGCASKPAQQKPEPQAPPPAYNPWANPHALTLQNPGATRPNAAEPPAGINFSNASGVTAQDAIVITGAKTLGQANAAEENWLARKYPTSTYQVITPVRNNGQYYDVAQVTIPDPAKPDAAGRNVTIYFRIVLPQ